MITHNFTVDVEEYFQVSALESVAPRNRWETYESRVAVGVDRLLELLDRHGARGTFFVLGWIARHSPGVVRAIADAGHEVASHGWGHRKVTGLSAQEFRESIRDARSILEDIAGTPVVGYRAPSFSIGPGMEWTLDVLLEEGYEYDSSLFPVRRDGYGYPTGQRTPHTLVREAGELWEIPPTTLRRFGQNLPAAGGAYFRLFPYRVFRTAFKESEARAEVGTFYIHPWELDPDQPRFPVGMLTRIRHYGGQARTYRRIDRLMNEFRFGSIRDLLAVKSSSGA